MITRSTKTVFVIIIVCSIILIQLADAKQPKKPKKSKKAGRGITQAKGSPCKPLRAKPGDEITDSTLGKKRIQTTKSNDMEDSGFPKVVITEITEIIEEWTKSDYSYSNSSDSSKHTIIEEEREEEVEDKLPTLKPDPIFTKDLAIDLDTQKKIAGTPDCIPSVRSKSRRKRSPEPKKGCRIVWVWPSGKKNKKPKCADYFKKNPGKKIESGAPTQVDIPPGKHKRTVIIRTEIWEDEHSEYWFKSSTSTHTRTETTTTVEEYEDGDYYLIKPEKKKSSAKKNDLIYTMIRISNLKPAETKLINDLASSKKYVPVVSLIWNKVSNEFHLTDVIIKPIDDLKGLCTSTPSYLDFMENWKTRSGSGKASALIVKKGSSEYKKLYGSKTYFHFSIWYKLYLETVLPGKFGPSNFVITATWDYTETDASWAIQTIKLIWDREEKIAGWAIIKITYLKKGFPKVEIQIFKGDRQKHYGYNCGIQKVLVPSDLEPVAKLPLKTGDMGGSGIHGGNSQGKCPLRLTYSEPGDGSSGKPPGDATNCPLRLTFIE